FSLSNLAGLLLTLPGRLTEARQLADEALAIKTTIDPGAAEIWKTYRIIAAVDDQEATTATESARKAHLQAQARHHRRLAREAKYNFAGTRRDLRNHVPLIFAAMISTRSPEHRSELEQALAVMEKNGWTRLVAAVRRILAGERDPDDLCATLDLEDSMVVE